MWSVMGASDTHLVRGFPVADDRRLFEKLCLEGFQSGLSWLTILKKRENFRAAFAGFDFHHVARFTERDVTRLLGDAGIVRHRGKIEATINNAQRALELVEAPKGRLPAMYGNFSRPLRHGRESSRGPCCSRWRRPRSRARFRRT
jgi:DNA-3-methyladenine glycosylase I